VGKKLRQGTGTSKTKGGEGDEKVRSTKKERWESRWGSKLNHGRKKKAAATWEKKKCTTRNLLKKGGGWSQTNQKRLENTPRGRTKPCVP